MSFALTSIGKPKDVAAAVAKDPHIPQKLKDFVQEFADNTPEVDSSGVKRVLIFTANGHYHPGNSWNSVNEFELNMATAAPESQIETSIESVTSLTPPGDLKK